MKKIFYFIASAIVALGAVACQNDIDETIDNNQQTEGYSIKVTIDEQTRVALGEADADNKRKLTFTEGDVLVVRSGWHEGTNYLFEYAKTEGDVYTFTCEAEGVNSLVGTNPYIFYLGGLHENADDLIHYGTICNTSAENISGIGMYYDPDNQSSEYKFGDEEYKVTLYAHPILKFTAYEPVTFKSTNPSQFFVNGEWAKEYTTKETGEIYLPIMPSSGNEYTITVTTESGFNKTLTKVFAENKIYNLGTIEAPAAPAEKVYLVPGVWNADGAWYAAYFFNAPASVQTRAAATDAWAKMTDEDANGVFECEIPAGFNSAIAIFCRMNPAFSDLAWDEMNGEEVVKDRVWNQSADLALPEGDKYCYINGWDSPATWGENPFAPETPNVASNWCIAGAHNGWGDSNGMVTTTVKNLFVAKNITLGAYGEFKVKVKGSWDGSYGAGDICYINKNSIVPAYVGSSNNFAAVEAGSYDIYFDALNTEVYLMVAGTDYSAAIAQTNNGPAPDMSSVSWGLAGAHNNWNAPDIALNWDGTIGMYVAKSAKLTGEFKIRADEDWATSFGSGGSITVNKAAATTVYNNGGNMKVTSGTYDVYFWYDTTNIKANGKIWVKTPGSAAPSL